MAAAEVASPVDTRIDLDAIFQQIKHSYSKEYLEKDIAFTKRTLGGEFLKFPDDDIEPFLKELQAQGRITADRPEYLEYYAKDNKSIVDRIKSLKKQSMKEKKSEREFVGRDEDVSAVVDHLKRRETALVNLHGDPGVGKTTLAEEVSNLLEAQGYVKIKERVDLRQMKDIRVVCSAVLYALCSPKYLQPCVEFLYEAIENLKQKTIIIFDNAEELFKQPFLFFWQYLKGMVEHNKNRKLLIALTSRVPLPGEVPSQDYINYHVKPLRESSSAAVLDKPNLLLTPEQTNEISTLCNNKPLLLKLVAAAMQEHLLNAQTIQAWKTMLSALEKPDRAKSADIYNSKFFNKVFENFMPELKKTTIKLSLFQGPFTLKDAMKMIKQPKSETLFYLQTLRDRSFLQEKTEKKHITYEMHPSINEFITEKRQEKENEDILTDAKETFFKIYLEKSKHIAQLLEKDYVRAYSVIEKERLNLKLSVEISFEMGFLYFSSDYSEASIIGDLFLILIPGLERERLFREWSTIAEKNGEWICYTNLVCMQTLVLLEKTAGRPEARRLLEKVEEVLNKLDDKSSDAYQLANSSFLFVKGEMAYSDCQSRGTQIWQLDDGEQVLEFYQKSLQIREKLLGDHTDTARTHNAIGNCYMHLDELEEALEYYTKALEMRQRLSGSQEHLDMPVYINQIGATHELLGKKYKKQSEECNYYFRKELTEKYRQEFDEALKKYQQALDLEKKLHISGYINTATFYRNMSNTFSYLEDYESSLKTAKKALFVRKRLLGIDSDTIRSYYQVGLAYEKLDETEKALKYFYKAYMMEQALPTGERSPVRDRVEAKIENNLGSTEEAEEADRRHKEALEKGSTDEEVLTSGDEKEEDDNESTIPSYSDESASSELEENDEKSSGEVSSSTKAQTTDQVPPGASVQTADQVPPGASVQTTDQLPPGASVKTTDQVPPGTSVKTTDQVPPGASVKTTDQVPPGTSVKTTDQVLPGTSVKTTDQVPPGTNVPVTDQVPSGASVQVTDQAPPDTKPEEQYLPAFDEVVVDSQTVGIRSLTWDIKDTGVRILILPETVPTDTSISCHVYVEPEVHLPLDLAESLVSRVVRLEADNNAFNKKIAVVIPHSGVSHTKGYELVVKEFNKYSETWEESEDFMSIQEKSDLQDVDDEFATQMEDLNLPAVLLTRQNCGMVCVTSRLITDKLIARPSGCTLVSSVFPDVQLVLEKKTVKKNETISIKVHPLPDFTVFNSPNFSCGPVLYLQIGQSEPVDVNKPVRIDLPHPLAWYDRYTEGNTRQGQVRVLYKISSDENICTEWQDITDNPGIKLSVNGQKISLEVRHFSMFWPIWISDVKQDIQKLLNKAKEQFVNLCRSSPFSAKFHVKCKDRFRKGQAILHCTVLPAHLDRRKNESSDEDLYNGEEIQVQLTGPIQRHLEETTSPDVFCIKFSSREPKTKSMHVDVEEEDGRFNCRFLRVLTDNKCICKVPFDLPPVPESKALEPIEFYGIPLEDPENKWKLLDTPKDVLHDILSKTTLHNIAKKAFDIKDDEESLKFFYRSVSHPDFQEDAFDAVVSNLKEASEHVKRILEAGKTVVEKPLDKETAKSLSHHIKEDYVRLAQVVDLSDKCDKVKKMKGTSSDRCYIFLQSWIAIKKPTLHQFMQKLKEAGCEKGMNALLQHFEKRLEKIVGDDGASNSSVSDSAVVTMEGRYKEPSPVERSLAGQNISETEQTSSSPISESEICPTGMVTGEAVDGSDGRSLGDVTSGDDDGCDMVNGSYDTSAGKSATGDSMGGIDNSSNGDSNAIEGSDASLESESDSADSSTDIIMDQPVNDLSLLYPGLCLIGLSLCYVYFRYARR